MNLKKVVFVLSILLWPVNLYRVNTPLNFVTYALPAILVGISFYFYRQGKSLFLLPILFLPAVSPKLLPIAILTTLTFYLMYRSKGYLPYLLISLLLLALFFKSFWGQTIFKPDYQARQTIIRNTYLYPNVLSARVFQNKLRIVTDKFNFNLTALIDPSNYLFGFHPREIMVDNQNLDKFPFLSLPFFLFSIYFLRKNEHWYFPATIFLCSVISLAFLNNFDRNDFILFTPLSIILHTGIDEFSKKFRKGSNIYYWIYTFFLLFNYAK